MRTDPRSPPEEDHGLLEAAIPPSGPPGLALPFYASRWPKTGISAPDQAPGLRARDELLRAFLARIPVRVLDRAATHR